MFGRFNNLIFLRFESLQKGIFVLKPLSPLMRIRKLSILNEYSMIIKRTRTGDENWKSNLYSWNKNISQLLSFGNRNVCVSRETFFTFLLRSFLYFLRLIFLRSKFISIFFARAKETNAKLRHKVMRCWENLCQERPLSKRLVYELMLISQRYLKWQICDNKGA